jgi:two-component system, chemotaxis family, sensor kinase CheA
MAIDMAQFHQVFFEESFEGLEIMESGLLRMEGGMVDAEEINAIFRAAHSIKGSSGTFGFNHIHNFTHVVETLLDQIRNGKRQPTLDVVSALLGSVDIIRDMLQAAQDGGDVDEIVVKEKRDDLQRILDEDSVEAVNTTEKPTGPPLKKPPTPTPAVEAEPLQESAAEPSPVGWHIIFRPLPHLTRTGNDPLRILRELAGLGELQVQADVAAVPGLSELEPEGCYISWDLRLHGDVAKGALDDVFDWVEDDCDLIIIPIMPEAKPSAKSKPGPQEEVVEPQVERRKEERRQDKRRSPLDRRSSERRATEATVASSSIRVDIGKVDSLINMVGELVITQSMLSVMGKDFSMERIEQLKDGLEQLERHTRELQESVMLIRMVPISFVFSRFPRMVHDLSARLGKKIELKMSGETTEVDKTVIEKISDPLVHLVRNSLDHGIEPPEERLAAGKPEIGCIELNAYHKGGSIIIEVKDDGCGLPKDKILKKAVDLGFVEENHELSERQIYELIFQPGFSTTSAVSDLSGRGVGMDVVRRNINELGGFIQIRSEEGVGSCFTIRLPLTLAILDGQIISTGSDTYIMPLVSIIESLQIRPDMINIVAGRGETVKLRDEYIPVIRLHEIFDVKDARATDLCEGLLVVVESDGRRGGLFVDDLVGQQQVVVKSLEANYQQVDGLSGATILGDGSVALILDVPGIFRLARGKKKGVLGGHAVIGSPESEVVGDGEYV